MDTSLSQSRAWTGIEGKTRQQPYVGTPLESPHNFTLLPGPSKHTQYPYVTGTSVLGIKYKDGVLLAADTAGSYGSTVRYKSVERLRAVGKLSAMGASGEISDFQQIIQHVDKLMYVAEQCALTNALGFIGLLGHDGHRIAFVRGRMQGVCVGAGISLNDYMFDDGNNLGPRDIHNYLTRLMYNKRNNFDPLWNTVVLGGVKDGEKYLGVVSMIGVHYEDNHVASGFGNHLARPIFRNEWREDLTLEEGIQLLEKALTVLFYRDRGAINKVQIANITEDGVSISEPYALKSSWALKAFKNPTAGAEGSW